MQTPSPDRPAESHVPSIVYFALAVGIICIGFAAIFVKLAATTGDVVAGWRLTIASFVLTPLVIANWRRGRARLPRSAIGLIVLGGLFFAADTAVWSTALTMADAATTTLLGNTSPLWVGLVAWLILREKLGPLYWVGLVVAMGGMALIIGLDRLPGQAINPGHVLALISGAIYAGFQLNSTRVRQKVDSLTYVWGFTLTGAVVLIALSQVLGHPLFNLPARSYLALLGLALFSHIGGWLLIIYAFGKLQTSRLTVTLLGQPIVTALVALPILGEVPTIWQVIGGVITLLGIYTVHRSGLNGQTAALLLKKQEPPALPDLQTGIVTREEELPS